MEHRSTAAKGKVINICLLKDLLDYGSSRKRDAVQWQQKLSKQITYTDNRSS